MLLATEQNKKDFIALIGSKIQGMNTIDELLTYLMKTGVISDNKVLFILIAKDYFENMKADEEVKISGRQFVSNTAVKYDISDESVNNIIYKKRKELINFDSI